MTEEKNNNYSFGSIDLIVFALKKWKILTIVSLVAFIGSIIISFQIPEKYRSTVVLFPSSSISVAKSLISYSSLEKGDVLSFGEEEEAERLLQILGSDAIRSKVVEKFNLMQHYDIEPDAKYAYTQLYDKFKGNVSTRRTEYMSIEISVMDESPDTAALIANYMADLIDTTIHQMQRKRALEAFELVKREYFNLVDELAESRDSLKEIQKKGVIDYESMAEVMNQEYAKAIAAGNMGAANILKQKLDILAEYGGAYVALRDYLEFSTENLTRLRSKYAEAKVMVDQNLPNTFIVDRAFPAEKKAVPKKSIIVIVTTLATFVFTLLLLLVLDGIKKRRTS